MKLLILDFLRRWWWMFALLFLITVVATGSGYPVVLTPIAVVCLMFDTARGLFRTIHLLPISRRTQAATWWFVVVVLVPLLAIVPLVLGTWLYLATHPILVSAVPSEAAARAGALDALASPGLRIAPWFSAVAQLWVGLGYGALCFLVAPILIPRPAAGSIGQIGQGLLSVLCIVAIFVLPFLQPYLPKSPAALMTWHRVVFAAVPVVVLVSFVVATDIIQRRLARAAEIARQPIAPAKDSTLAGLTGVPLFFTQIVARMVLIHAFIVCFQFVSVRLFARHFSLSTDPMLAGQGIFFAVMFVSSSMEGLGLRAMRALPLSTTRLASLLLSTPVALGFSGALFTFFWFGVGDRSLPAVVNYAAQAIAIAGFSALTIVVSLHIASNLRLLVFMGAMIPATGFAFLAKTPALLAVLGLGALVGAFALLHRGLRKSPAFYQPRRLFGIGVGQAVTTR